MHMQRQTYEFVEVSDGQFPPQPIILKQNNRKLARLPGLLLMTTLAGLIVAPQILIAAYAFGSPEVRASLIAHPWASLELAVALCFWVGLVCWPVRSMLMALVCHRSVEISNGEVKVIDETPFSTLLRRTPLTTYEGIALDVRSSLSSIRHEATLVHPDRRRSVVLTIAEHIGELEIQELCRVLGLPRIRAGSQYGLGDPPGGHEAAEITAVAA
jgi:hypothetical protein